MTVLTLNLQQFIETADEFWVLCQANPELRLERTATGEVVIMLPAFSETGRYNSAISGNYGYVAGDPVLPEFSLNLQKVWG